MMRSQQNVARIRYRQLGMVDPHHLTFSVLAWTLVLQLSLTGARCRVTSQRIEIEDKPAPRGPRVYLTVSSLASHNVDGVVSERQLELNWFEAPPGMNEDPASWVGLFNHDPAEGTHDPLEIAPTRTNSEGYYKTKISYPRYSFTPTDLNDRCLGYWIGYINLNRLMAKSCIRARPHWMHEMREIIGNLTLLDIMIPGTHNAGSYESYKPEKNTPKIRYQICQDEDIWTQLVYGNRFLDLRVTFQHVAGSREKFWISHGFLRTNNSLKEVLSQVQTFLDNTNEIVIMDFHLFYFGFIDNWIEERHRELITIITRQLGSYMIPKAYEYKATMDQLWRNKKRLLVGYSSKQEPENPLLFPEVFHLWGNKETKQELQEFLEQNLCRLKHNALWSAMAELTPTAAGILIDKYGGLRAMAQDVNTHLTRWFRDKWWNCSNIVATDYFLGNDIINVALDANRQKIQNYVIH